MSDHRIALAFTDGLRGELDLHDWVVGQGGVFTALEDPQAFAKVQLSETGGTIEWPNGVDFCPDVLHEELLRQSLAASTAEHARSAPRT